MALDGRGPLCWDRGQLVTELVTASRRSLSFSLFDYFVEISLDQLGDGIAEIIPFRSGERYFRMIDSIKLDHLM